MRWFEVDGACEYLAQQEGGEIPKKDGGKKPSRKTVYNMVAAGMKVARLGDSGRRYMFSAEWIDEFLEQRAKAEPTSIVGDMRRRA